MTQGQMLRDARSQKKLRLVDLAERVGVSASFLSQLERGICRDVSTANAKKIIEALDLPDGFFGNAVAGRDSDLDRFADEYDIPFEHRQALKVATATVPVYRGEAVAERNTMEWYGKFYENVKPYLPPVERTRLETPVVSGMLRSAGLNPEDELELILDQIEERFSPSEITDAKERGTILCGNFGIVTKVILGPESIHQIKNWCLERGLYTVIGDLFSYAENIKLLGGTYPIQSEKHPQERFLILMDAGRQKKYRREFTFWHEIAHILMDPDLKRVPARRGSGIDVKEWFIDQVAGRLAFPKKIFGPIVQQLHKNMASAMLSLRQVEGLRGKYAPRASRQMVARMIVNYWPEPLVYLEAALQLKKNERIGEKDDDYLSPLAKLRVNLVQTNGLAKEAMPDIPRNFRVPESSIVFAAYKAFSEKTVLGPQKESFSRWTSSTGQSLGDGDYWVSASAEPDEDTLNSPAQRIRAYAFLTSTKKEGRPNE